MARAGAASTGPGSAWPSTRTRWRDITRSIASMGSSRPMSGRRMWRRVGSRTAGKIGACELSSPWRGNQMQAQEFGESVFSDGALGEGEYGSEGVGILGDQLESIVEKEHLGQH